MRIELYSHGMKVTGFDQNGKRALLEFCRGLAKFGYVRVGRGQFVYQMVAIYAGRTNDHSEFRFHRNLEKPLRQHLIAYGLNDSKVEWVERPLYEPVKTEFTWKSDKQPFDYQVPQIEYCLAPGKTKVLMIQTGKGKGMCSMQSVLKMGQRCVIVVGGKYIDKWRDEIKEFFKLKTEDLMIVRGSEHLKRLIELGMEGSLTSQFILITSTTMYNYIKSFEKFGYVDVGYHVPPDQFYETIGAGVRVIDEVHENFHLNFRQDIYTNVPKTISMSATLDHDDGFINKMYEIVFPHGERPPKMALHKYIAMKGLTYALRNPKRVRFKNAMKQYSHVIFEQSLMRQKDMLDGYLNMVFQIVNHSYIKVRQPGQKCLVYFATVDFCTLFQKLMKQYNPELVVNRYTSDDEYEDLLKADIAVTTLQSAGTAVDIPGLRMVLMTTALSSKTANAQALGRLRELKGDWANVTPEFLFLACRDIDKHMQYANDKTAKLGDKVLSFNMYQTQFHI